MSILSGGSWGNSLLAKLKKVITGKSLRLIGPAKGLGSASGKKLWGIFIAIGRMSKICRSKELLRIRFQKGCNRSLKKSILVLSL